MGLCCADWDNGASGDRDHAESAGLRSVSCGKHSAQGDCLLWNHSVRSAVMLYLADLCCVLAELVASSKVWKLLARILYYNSLDSLTLVPTFIILFLCEMIFMDRSLHS